MVRKILGLLFSFLLIGSYAGAEENQGVPPVESDQTGFYYIIKKGDTLWDLSRRFLNSEWEWPQMWKDNHQEPIYNPHLIYPGQRIRLRRRGSAPALALTLPVTTPAPAVQPKVIKPVIQADFYKYARINMVGFIRKEIVSPHGVIFKVKEDKTLIGMGDILYIRPTGGTPLIMGRQYYVYKTIGPLNDPDTKNEVGYQHYYTGVVEITVIEEQFAIALVKETFREMVVGEMLIPFEPSEPKVILSKAVKGLQGKIIAGEEGQILLGELNIAFINKGTVDGVQAGQQYQIFYQEAARVKPDDISKITLTPVEYASLIVLRVEQATATVLITDSKRTVKPGSTIYNPE